MWTPAILTAALALGQPGVQLPDPARATPAPMRAPVAPPYQYILDKLPAQDGANPPAPPADSFPTAWATAPEPPPPEATPEPITINAPLLPPPAPPPAPAAPAAPAAAPPPRWFLMKELQGTFLGSQLDGHNIAIYGWVEGSYTGSSAGITNEPMAWNDRANRFLLQQMFIRMERTVVTTGTQMPTWGFRTDWLVGSDYRFTLPRGIWNSQLVNSAPTQNLYGVDPVEFYGEVYIPTVQQGLDIKVGRFYTPWGEESVEAVSTPLVSRSYTFNSGPPFTNTGVLATLTLNPEWQVAGGYVIGNDTFFDKGDEGRFLGFAKWTQPSGGRNTVTVATTLGRGKFNDQAPLEFPAVQRGATITTGGISGEAGLLDGNGNVVGAGRNNINVFDVLYTHTFNPVLSYAAEGLYGYETNVPAVDLPGRLDLVQQGFGTGTAHWASLAQYLIYTMSPRLTATLRVEGFYDFEGFRTATEGLTTEITGGLAFKYRPGLIVRPELRWDQNGYTRGFNVPLDPSHNLYTAACDVIVRW
jgi:hypothetical protein